MNEQIVISLLGKNGVWPITGFGEEGVQLSGETDAFPRHVDFWIDPRNEVTNSRVRWILQLREWNRLKLRASRKDSELTLQGLDEYGLPPGYYDVKISVEGLAMDNDWRAKYLPENGTLQLKVPAKEDPRQIELLPLDDRFTPILAASSLDNEPAVGWLGDPSRQACRRACLLNIFAKLRCFPTRTEPFIDHITNVWFAATDRIYATVKADLHRRLLDLAADPKKPVYHEGAPTSDCHRRLLTRLTKEGLEADTAGYTLDSFRTEGGPSVQIVVAAPPTKDGNYYADIDIDLGNPLQDIAGLIVHAGEVASGKITDHLSLWKKLRKRPEKDFLDYRVTPS